jgi:hypothetical protein
MNLIMERVRWKSNSKQMPCIRMCRMLHTRNASSLLLRPLAIEAVVIEAPAQMLTVPRASTSKPLVISAAETFVIEAHVTVSNAAAYRPLITVAETLVIEAPITVAEAPAQMLPITVDEAPLQHRCNPRCEKHTSHGYTICIHVTALHDLPISISAVDMPETSLHEHGTHALLVHKSGGACNTIVKAGAYLQCSSEHGFVGPQIRWRLQTIVKAGGIPTTFIRACSRSVQLVQTVDTSGRLVQSGGLAFMLCVVTFDGLR